MTRESKPSNVSTATDNDGHDKVNYMYTLHKAQPSQEVLASVTYKLFINFANSDLQSILANSLVLNYVPCLLTCHCICSLANIMQSQLDSSTPSPKKPSRLRIFYDADQPLSSSCAYNLVANAATQCWHQVTINDTEVIKNKPYDSVPLILEYLYSSGILPAQHWF